MQLENNSYIAKKENKLFDELDKGIDDMEMGRELPIDAAFEKINQKRETNRVARA